MRRIGEHAVVLGASMAGLLAARALSDRFERVTVVERDHLPPLGEQRRGVPQGQHTHGLLARGAEVLEEVFPGITSELVAAGAVKSDNGLGRWHHQGGYAAKVETGLTGLMLSRPLLEGHVRRRLFARHNVNSLQGWDALGVDATPDKTRIVGAVVRPRDGGDRQVLPADLVVDATGRGSHSPTWLAHLGYEPPAQLEVGIDLGYVTRSYRRRPRHLDGDLLVIVAAQPPNRRVGVAIAQEHDTWTVTLAGYLGEHAPTDEHGFVAFAAGLPAPDIHRLLREAEPLTEPVFSRFPASRRRRYEDLRRFPEGYLVVGDAICSFNPIYGQGMTVAALQSLALAESLDNGGLRGLAARFFPSAGRLIDIPWGIAVGSDLRYAEVVGTRSTQVRFVNWYLERFHRAAHRDPVLARRFQEVANLVASPDRLLRPDVVGRVIAGTVRQAPPGRARGRMRPAPTLAAPASQPMDVNG